MSAKKKKKKNLTAQVVRKIKKNIFPCSFVHSLHAYVNLGIYTRKTFLIKGKLKLKRKE